MKTNTFFKTFLLLLLAAAGTTTAWADAVAIPQDLGNYITWDKASTNCTVQGENTYVGNTNGDDKYAEFTITNSTEQSYIMTFATGSTSGNTGHLNVVLTNSGSTKVLEAVATVEDTGGWTNFNTVNYYSLENLPIGTYTLRISVKDRTGYCGNWSKLAFYSAEQCALPLKSSANYLEMSTGVFNKANDNSDNVINYIRPNGYISNVLTYNSTEDFYLLNFNLDAHKGYADSKVRITVYNALTGTQELQATADASTGGDKMCALPAKLSTGWKTIRFDFLSETAAAEDSESDKRYLYNFRQVNFSPLSQTMPLVGGTPNILDLSVWPTSGNPRYQDGDKNLGYIYNGNTANFYFVNENEPALYYLQAGISANVDGASLKVTITDCATGTTEVEQTFDVAKTSGYATQSFKLNNAITAGVKNIRFDFIKDAEASWLYNINNVSFYKRSLNEAYDYAPVAADGVDVVLTRSLSAGKWSTIMLPFDISATDLGTALGTTVTLAAFTSFSDNALNFTTASSIAANTPYMIKVSGDVTEAKTINGVNIVTTGNQYVDQSGVRFQGVYASTNMEAGDYFFSNNNLYKATSSTKPIKPFRAYFKDVPAGAHLMFYDETTGISEMEKMRNGENERFFDLQGRRIAQPTKGLYIVNGKKVVLK